MTCNDILELVSAECDGAASAEERRAIEAHLAACAACAEAARELRAAVEAVRGLPPEIAPADMASRVGRALERERVEVAPPVSRFRLVTRRVMPVAMAAAAVLIVALLNASIFIAQAVKSSPSGRLQSETSDRGVASRPAHRDAFERDSENQAFEPQEEKAIVDAGGSGQNWRAKNSEKMKKEAAPSIALLRAQEELERKAMFGLPLAVSREFSQSAPRPADAMNRVSSLLSDLRAQYEVSKQPDGSYVFDVTMDANEGEQLPVYLANLEAGDSYAFGADAKERRRALRLEKAPGSRSAEERDELSAMPDGGVSHTGGAIALGGGWSMEPGGEASGRRLRGLEDRDAGRLEDGATRGGLAAGGGGSAAGSPSASAETERPLAQGKADDQKAQEGEGSLAGQSGAKGGGPGGAADERVKAEEAGLAMAGEDASKDLKKTPPAADKGYVGKSPVGGSKPAGADAGKTGEQALAAGDVEDLVEDVDKLKENAKLKAVTEAESGRTSAPPTAPPETSAASDPTSALAAATDSSIALPPGAPPPAGAAAADRPAATPAQTPAKVPHRIRVRIRIVPK